MHQPVDPSYTIEDLVADYGETADVFRSWAPTAGISLAREEDWEPWWNAFNAGVNWRDEDYRDVDDWDEEE